MSKRAIILCGGKGTRLRPYTVVLPKPLMPIGEYPILEVVVRQLSKHGFDHLTLAVNHQADIIKAFFGDGSKWNIKIDYSMESKPLSTMGPLTLIDDLPNDFLIMNGDVLSDLDYGQFYSQHVNSKSVFTISSHYREHVNLYGVLEKNEAEYLTGFKEKPITSFEVSMGVYMANKAILKYIPHNTSFGFDHLMLALLKDKNPAMVRQYKGYWLDIGRPDDYMTAIEVFEKEPERFI